MRDPNRIPRILHKLCVVWNENPDQRLIQLLMNVAGVPDSPEAFYTEDDVVENGLTKNTPTPGRKCECPSDGGL